MGRLEEHWSEGGGGGGGREVVWIDCPGYYKELASMAGIIKNCFSRACMYRKL